MAAPFREQERTLKAIRSGLHTAREIFEADPERESITMIAVSQRLRRLWKAGLVSREKGPDRFYRYTLTGKKESHGRGRTKRRAS